MLVAVSEEPLDPKVTVSPRKFVPKVTDLPVTVSVSFWTSNGMVTRALVSIFGFQNVSVSVTVKYGCGWIG